uniref:Error-prone, lesion bypass DNA polymerase V (UmuC) n=1 Tax=Escherichia coli TaxID=562 RepID=A0A2L1KKQ3_ECOLX|nr:Error-prone, lesion bypass DNA polymerase V (UmuC) [Escherichia coli]
MFALADINSFYASCEKVFRPDLRNEPVIVLTRAARRQKPLASEWGSPGFR